MFNYNCSAASAGAPSQCEGRFIETEQDYQIFCHNLPIVYNNIVAPCSHCALNRVKRNGKFYAL